MRVVLDTNILARAACSETGPAAKLLDRMQGSDHVLIVSEFILSELDRILRYPRLHRLHGFVEEEIEEFVAGVQAASLSVEFAEGTAKGIVSSDPNDDPVVATAVTGQAEVLCTLDRHLHCQDVRDYCSQHKIEVLTDIELLTRVRQLEADKDAPA